MRVLRAIAGVFLGFLTMAVLSSITTAVLRRVWPELGTIAQPVALVMMDAGYATLYMLLAGFVAWRVGGRAALYVLAGIVLALTISTAVVNADVEHPVWYSWLLIGTAAPAVMVGGYLGLRKKADPT